MSEDKVLPKGLCEEEVERGKIERRPKVLFYYKFDFYSVHRRIVLK
jgi:hypothetical protein